MNVKDDPFYEIETILMQLRQQAKTRQRFPQEVWNTIIRLAQAHSIQDVSLRLNISPAYLKRKIKESHEISSLNFREISSPVQACSNMVYVELSSEDRKSVV